MGKVGQIVTGLIAIAAGFAVETMYNFITGVIGSPQSVVDLRMVVTGARWLFFGIGGIIIVYALVSGLFGGRKEEQYRRQPPEPEREREPPERRESDRRDERQRERDRAPEGRQQDETDEAGSSYTERINQARRQRDER